MKVSNYVPTVLLSISLCSCGGSNAPKPQGLPAATAACADGFSNNTTLPTGASSATVVALSPSNSTLWDQWRQAQTELSTRPIPYLNGSSMPPNPAAAAIEPNCQAVVAVSDMTDAQLAQSTGNNRWLTHSEPTGAFLCGGQAVNGCYVNGIVYVAASLAWNSVYEIQNAILSQLDEVDGR